KAGMIDGIRQWPEVVKGLRSAVIPHRANARNLAISSPSAPALAIAAPIPAAPVKLSRAEAERAKAEAGKAARIAAICRSPEGEADPELAAELALETNVPVADALAKLRAKASERSW